MLAMASPGLVNVAMILTGALVGGVIAYWCARAHFAGRLLRAKRLHGVVNNLLDMPQSRDDDWISHLLERLAQALGADCAWLLIGKDPATNITWAASQSLSLAEAQSVTQTATMRFPWQDDCISIGPDRRTDVVNDQSTRTCSLVRAKTILLRSSLAGEEAILGFSERRSLSANPEIINAARAVFSATLQTLRRQHIERRQLRYERDAALGRRMETFGTFASGMAHNLNNILAAIAGFNAIIEMHTAPNSVIGRSVADIDTAVRRGRAIVGEVLSFGRRLERTSSTVDIGELLSETAVMMAVSLPDKITLRTGEPLDRLEVTGNFGQLQQVLLNICNNAAFAMPDGGVITWESNRVVVDDVVQTSHATLACGTYVNISIRDEGSGMTPSVASHIFEPFFTTRVGGTGLGLSTARDIVAKHGGAIDVRSAPNEGSDFTLWLPAVAIRSPPPAPPITTGGGEVVLIINVDANRLAIDEELVAALGYEPSGLLDAADIDDFEGFVDLVLIAGVDDGMVTTTLEIVRGTKWRVPVLLATAWPSPNIPIQPLSYPLRPVDLATALSHALHSMEPHDLNGWRIADEIEYTR
jgi:signal transduction histidine kinase